MDNTDWRSQPLTWTLLRTHFGAWFARHRIALSIALAVAVIVWGVCRGVANIGNVPIPKDAALVSITNYAQAYDVYKQGTKVILDRVRDEEDLSMIMAGFGITWWLVYSIQEYQSDRKRKGFSKATFIAMNALFALYLAYITYVYAYPSLMILIHPQMIILDPEHDLVTLNNVPLGRMSEIEDFEGVEKEGYHYDWTWFGVKLKNGRYYSFNEGQFVGANVQSIAGYLNGYLKQYPPNSHSSR